MLIFFPHDRTVVLYVIHSAHYNQQSTIINQLLTNVHD